MLQKATFLLTYCHLVIRRILVQIENFTDSVLYLKRLRMKSQLKIAHPDKSVMLVAEKGTMGVGSSRMSGVNNVALWTGRRLALYSLCKRSSYCCWNKWYITDFSNYCWSDRGIGIDLKNWVKKKDSDGNIILNNDGEPILEQLYSVETGTELTINTKTKKLYNKEETKELVDVSSSFTGKKVEFMKAGGSYSIVFGKNFKILQLIY